MNKPQSKHNAKHKNQVRIVGGTHRGRKLTFHDAEGLRPTPDSVRERLFNWLGQDLSGKTVLDLFAGSGALGFEAASRHARKVYLCDTNRQTVRQLNEHVREFDWANRVSVEAQDGIAWLRQSTQQFDVVLLDPPFAWQGWQELFAALPERLAENAMVYVEAGALPEFPDYLECHREGRAGQSSFVLLKRAQQADK